MRDRSGVIILQDDQIALIKRVKKTETYYVIPGGGIEKGETPEETAIREAKEELGVDVEIKRLLHTEHWNGTQYFFLAKVICGKFGSGNGEEMSEKNELNGSYLPMWIRIAELNKLPLRPKTLIDKISSLT